MDPHRTTAPHSLFWGDLHKHMTGPGAPVEAIGEKLDHARAHLDFSVAYCYPFDHYEQGDGLTIETVGSRPIFQEWWEAVQERAAEHNDPGTFVTFPAYEWHGDRRRWGDHHVIYREEGHPLDATADIRELSERLADRPAVLVPHHTGYRVGERGKDWDVFDPDLSPVMEVYSTHGSSEGIDTPVDMAFNESMGPRTSGGTFQDAVDRGYRIGVVASNDGPGVPGAWGRGLAGVWADELTRAGIWEAIDARRTYGVTGDRIALWWTLDGAPMGGTISTSGGSELLDAAVDVDCPQPLDRIEVLRNGDVVDTYTHQDADRDRDPNPPGVYRCLVEFGWGPTRDYGPFDDTNIRWEGAIAVEDGELRAVSPRFVGPGQRYAVDDDRCTFSLLTSRDDPPAALPEGTTRSHRQGLVVEFEASEDTILSLDLEDEDTYTVGIDQAIQQSHLVPHYGTAMDFLEAVGIDEASLGNMDRRYHVAPKTRIGRAHPRSACAASVTLPVRAAPGDCVYIRASEVNGQYAWASPVWVSERAA